MGLINREIVYRGSKQFIEHVTGKRVRSYNIDYMRARTEYLFDDGTALYLCEGEELRPDRIVYHKAEDFFCLSCGEASHPACEWDWRGWCSTTVKNFYENVRKVYWHRYSKSK